MTLTTKNPNESDSSAKTGAPSQNSESNPSQSSRSNPVCLEVGVTLRSLPTETGDVNKPILEGARTVIVFDNGAVLRSSNNLPSGQKVILTNPQGREVVCKVASGRNMPSVKGYVEVEFVDAVRDFWHLQQNVVAGVPAPLAAPAPASTETFKGQGSSPSETPRPVTPAVEATKSANQPSGSGPSFEDIPGLIAKPPRRARRETKLDPAQTGNSAAIKGGVAHVVNDIATPPSLVARSLNLGSPRKRPAISSSKEEPQTTLRLPSQTPDFMSSGLFTSAQSQTPSSASRGRLPLIIGAVLLVVAGTGAAIFLTHGGFASLPFLGNAVETGASASAPPPAVTAPDPVQSSRKTQSQTATTATPKAAEQAKPAAAVIPISAANVGAGTVETKMVPQQGKNLIAGKQPDTEPSRRQSVPNLKMKSPTSPNHKLANPVEEAAPVAEVPSTESVNGAPPIGLLSAVSRTSAPPAPLPTPPATAPPVKILIDPKLISSTRPMYPVTARESKIQGSVQVVASIDERGNVVAAKATSGPPLLQQAAIDSVKQWKYSPASLDGKPAPSQVTITIEFRLK